MENHTKEQGLRKNKFWVW